jgi:hypothetical protein
MDEQMIEESKHIALPLFVMKQRAATIMHFINSSDVMFICASAFELL